MSHPPGLLRKGVGSIGGGVGVPAHVHLLHLSARRKLGGYVCHLPLPFRRRRLYVGLHRGGGHHDLHRHWWSVLRCLHWVASQVLSTFLRRRSGTRRRACNRACRTGLAWILFYLPYLLRSLCSRGLPSRTLLARPCGCACHPTGLTLALPSTGQLIPAAIWTVPSLESEPIQHFESAI